MQPGFAPSTSPTSVAIHFSLRRKLLIGTIVVQLIVLVVLMLAAQRVIHRSLVTEVSSGAVITEQLLGSSLAPLIAAKDVAALREITEDTVRATGLAYLDVAGLDGRSIARAGDLPAIEPPARFDPQTPRPSAHDGVFHFGAPIRLSGQDYGRVAFGMTVKAAAAERDLLMQLALFGAAGLAASLLLQLLLTGVLTNGLTRMSRAAEQVGAGRFDIDLPVQGQDEIAALSGALNRMSSALAERVRALEDSELRQRSMIEAMAEGLVVQDAHDRILLCNEAAPCILGMTRNQLLGLDSMDPRWHAVTRDGQPFEPQNHPSMAALRTGKPQRGVLMGVHKNDGTLAWISINSEPLVRSGESAPYATVTTFDDITPLIEAEERLLQLNSDLEQRVAQRTADLAQALDLAESASRAKSEFLSRMSHELRTPLNAILGFAQILRLRGTTLAPSEREQQVQQIETAGWHLLELINEVLDLARIESGAMTVSREPVLLQALVADCVQMVQPAARAMTVELVDQVASAPQVQVTRPPELNQVITNLLSNGVKYNRRGGRVTLTVRAVDPAWVELAVEDTGRGFSDAQLRNLYQPFNRLGADTTQVEGAGIGLVITKRLTELMGGSLELVTVEGRGSVFTLRLRHAGEPADAPATVPTPPPAAPPARPKLVLYIEDNPSNVELLRGVLSLRPGLQLIDAGDGLSGLALAHERLPDLIVVDIALPGMDGYQVCGHLRAHPDFATRPIIALSANAMQADIQKGRAAGFDAYLTKPLDVPVILAQIDQLLQRSAA
ncbi:MAG: ATP-binding protein [Burkholderiaceae bacterium]|nr:ATP-binding protein [Burkholderiaceae bacterium]